MISQLQMPSGKTLVSTAASVAAMAMLVRSLARDLVPYEIQRCVSSSIRSFLQSLSSDVVLIIDRSEGLVGNQIYAAAEIYLGSGVSLRSQKFNVIMPEKETEATTSLAEDQEIVDVFDGVLLKWRYVAERLETTRVTSVGPSTTVFEQEDRYLELRFHKKHREMVLNSYLPHVIEESKRLRREKKTPRIHTLNGDKVKFSSVPNAWISTNLHHPATLENLAMDSDLKRMITEDLERFLKRRDFYRKVGKAWKRGYLLYGPPGSGKSNLVAAIANYLNFDIYDLKLSNVNDDSDMKRLLIGMENPSILVVEDIDCELELANRRLERSITKLLRSNPADHARTVNIVHQHETENAKLSKLFNFLDGLWSSCMDGQIIILTTNYKDRLDPALLRPGRMDVQVNMPYCTPEGFKLLVSNYLRVTDHSILPAINDLLVTKPVTPAEVANHFCYPINLPDKKFSVFT